LYLFAVMTSWQNILDHLPNGTGRPATRNNNRDNQEFTHRPSSNDNEGIEFGLEMK
jgi:hypothetical protein